MPIVRKLFAAAEAGYVSAGKLRRSESRWPGLLVIGKLKFLWLQPNSTSSRLAINHHPQTSGLPWKR